MHRPLVAIAALSWACVCGDQILRAQTLAAIEGVVRDTNGVALPSALVTCASRANVTTVYSSANGAFRCTRLPAGRFRVTARKAGFLTRSYGQPIWSRHAASSHFIPVSVALGDPPPQLSLVLPRAAAIEGRIVDEDGHPMMNLPVTVLGADLRGGQTDIVSFGSSRTDDRGRYRIWGLASGAYYVQAAPTAAQLVGRTGERALAPTYFPGVASRALASLVEVTDSTVVGIDFVSRPVRIGAISGQVLDSSGNPRRATVRAVALGDDAGARSEPTEVRASATGDFAFYGLPPGSYELNAAITETADRVELGQLQVALDEKDIDSVVISTKPSRLLRGTVASAGLSAAILSRAQVVLIGVGGTTAATTRARVAGDGSFELSMPSSVATVRLTGLPAGVGVSQMALNNRLADGALLDVSSVLSPLHLSISLTKHLPTLTVQVFDERGEPAPGAQVLIYRRSQPLELRSPPAATARADHKGTVIVEHLSPGSYRLFARSAQSLNLEPFFLPNEVSDGVDATMTEGAVITVRATIVR